MSEEKKLRTDINIRENVHVREVQRHYGATCARKGRKKETAQVRRCNFRNVSLFEDLPNNYYSRIGNQ